MIEYSIINLSNDTDDFNSESNDFYSVSFWSTSCETCKSLIDKHIEKYGYYLREFDCYHNRHLGFNSQKGPVHEGEFLRNKVNFNLQMTCSECKPQETNFTFTVYNKYKKGRVGIQIPDYSKQKSFLYYCDKKKYYLIISTLQRAYNSSFTHLKVFYHD